MKKLAIVLTHPVQYYSPIFKLLNERGIVKPKVFYTFSQAENGMNYDKGFGKNITWDIPLLEGYEFEFVPNTSNKPGLDSFFGVVNPDLFFHIAKWKPDAILIFGWNYASHFNALRNFKSRIPVIFRGDSTLLDEKRGFKKLLRRIFLSHIYKNIDLALYVGENNRQYFLAHGVSEERMLFAPHAIDNERFSCEDFEKKKAAQLWRTELGIDENDFVILFAGKFEPKKNPHFIVELAKICTDSTIKFLLAGNGVLEEELKLASSNDPRIIFIGFQNQSKMPILYRMANVFVLPSTGPGETWGLAINEAMASGTPVIASRMAGGAIDLINENNGLIIEPGDTLQTAHFIARMMSDSQFQTQLSNAASADIRKFSFHNVVDPIENYLNN